jgi:hypothetical protein
MLVTSPTNEHTEAPMLDWTSTPADTHSVNLGEAYAIAGESSPAGTWVAVRRNHKRGTVTLAAADGRITVAVGSLRILPLGGDVAPAPQPEPEQTTEPEHRGVLMTCCNRRYATVAETADHYPETCPNAQPQPQPQPAAPASRKRLLVATLASLLVAMAMLVGMGGTAQAASVHTYNVPKAHGCGTMLALTVKHSGTAVFMRERCDQVRKGEPTGSTRAFEAPDAGSRKGCGPLLQVRVGKHSAMFRYAACDRTVTSTSATE